eukprot:1071945-Amphidinium_carterae.4
MRCSCVSYFTSGVVIKAEGLLQECSGPSRSSRFSAGFASKTGGIFTARAQKFGDRVSLSSTSETLTYLSGVPPGAKSSFCTTSVRHEVRTDRPCVIRAIIPISVSTCPLPGLAPPLGFPLGLPPWSLPPLPVLSLSFPFLSPPGLEHLGVVHCGELGFSPVCLLLLKRPIIQLSFKEFYISPQCIGCWVNPNVGYR